MRMLQRNKTIPIKVEDPHRWRVLDDGDYLWVLKRHPWGQIMPTVIENHPWNDLDEETRRSEKETLRKKGSVLLEGMNCHPQAERIVPIVAVESRQWNVLDEDRRRNEEEMFHKMSSLPSMNRQQLQQLEYPLERIPIGVIESHPGNVLDEEPHRNKEEKCHKNPLPSMSRQLPERIPIVIERRQGGVRDEELHRNEEETFHKKSSVLHMKRRQPILIGVEDRRRNG
jgi:hypothetical protein